MEEKDLENITLVIKKTIQRVNPAVRRIRAQVFVAINNDSKHQIDDNNHTPDKFSLLQFHPWTGNSVPNIENPQT